MIYVSLFLLNEIYKCIISNKDTVWVERITGLGSACQIIDIQYYNYNIITLWLQYIVIYKIKN